MSVDSRIHTLLNTDFQQVNQFKLLFIENFSTTNFSSFTSVAGSVLGGAASLLVSEYYVQSVTIPSPVTLEYEQSDMNFVKTLKRPDNVTVSFLETEDAVVWRFIQDWRKSTVNVAPISLKQGIGAALKSGLASTTGQSIENVKYMFNDDQTQAMKTGMLFPYGTGKRKIGKFPRIILRNMRFVENSELQWSYTEAGNLIITATFSVSEIACPSLF